jgi:plastocyanin
VRLGLLLLAGIAGALAFVLPALAASDQTVQARDNFFDPRTVVVAPGDKLTVVHAGTSAHGVKFDDEAVARHPGGVGWTVERIFTAAEARDEPYGYVCPLHPAMTGRVYVNATGTVPSPPATPPAPPPPAPTATPYGTATPDGDGYTPPPATGGSGTQPAAQLRAARMSGTSFCTRRSPTCSRPGVRLRIDLSAPAQVGGTLTRRARPGARFRRFGSVGFGRVAAGPRTLSFTRTTAGRRLTRGAYRLALRAAGETRTLSFRVR